MTEYYENGPEGMPRVERMTRSTIMAVLSQKDVPTIYVSREEDYNSLCKFAHAVAEETLARVPAWPAERTTAPVSLTDEQIEELAVKYESFGFGQAGKKSELSIHGFEPEGLREFARALLAAAPAPIQKEPEATHKRQVFMDEIDAAKAGSEWLEPFFGPGFRLSFSVDEGARAPQAKWCILFDSLDRVVAGYMLTRDAKNWTELTKVGPHATPPALAGSQVQAAGDARKLNWGEVSRPSEEIGYDHVIAQTPFGRVLITWKGWKDYPSFEIEDHPLEIVRNWCGSSLESAKEEAERAYFEAIDAAMREQP